MKRIRDLPQLGQDFQDSIQSTFTTQVLSKVTKSHRRARLKQFRRRPRDPHRRNSQTNSLVHATEPAILEL